jgi:hypothetical protein
MAHMILNPGTYGVGVFEHAQCRRGWECSLNRLVDVGDSWGALLGPPVCQALGWRRIMDTVAPCIS